MSDVKHDLYLAYRGHGYNRSDSIDISNRFYNSVLDEAIIAVQKEKLQDKLDNAEDVSYNAAVSHSTEAIRDLKRE